MTSIPVLLTSLVAVVCALYASAAPLRGTVMNNKNQLEGGPTRDDESDLVIGEVDTETPWEVASNHWTTVRDGIDEGSREELSQYLPQP